MDLEPQARKTNPNTAKPVIKSTEVKAKLTEPEEPEVIEGMTERDHMSDDLKDSPLKIFMNTELFLLVAGLIIGAIYFFFFRGA